MTGSHYLDVTRAAYDTVAAEYAKELRTDPADKPLDRAMFSAFAELVQENGGLPVADLGCGPGHLTGHLHGLGLDVFGVDLSPAMIAIARATYPDLRFDEGSMTRLGLADGALGGILAWYSIIHVPPAELPDLFAEFHRMLAPGGHLLLGFQVGDERRQIEKSYGHEVSVDAYRLPPEEIRARLADAGLPVRALSTRDVEGVGQAHVLAHKPGLD